MLLMEIKMKLALIILGLFFLSLTVRSRELTFSEKTVLLNHEKSLSVKTFMENRIVKSKLSMRDYIGFLALRKSCDPINLMIKFVENQKDDFEDQSKKMIPLTTACEKGTISMGHLYIGQQEN